MLASRSALNWTWRFDALCSFFPFVFVSTSMDFFLFRYPEFDIVGRILLRKHSDRRVSITAVLEVERGCWFFFYGCVKIVCLFLMLSSRVARRHSADEADLVKRCKCMQNTASRDTMTYAQICAFSPPLRSPSIRANLLHHLLVLIQ